MHRCVCPFADVLGALELGTFPLLGAGTADVSELGELATVSILELQSLIFASVCGCVVLVLRIIQVRRAGPF